MLAAPIVKAATAAVSAFLIVMTHLQNRDPVEIGAAIKPERGLFIN